jgi:hypothetical protein
MQTQLELDFVPFSAEAGGLQRPQGEHAEVAIQAAALTGYLIHDGLKPLSKKLLPTCFNLCPTSRHVGPVLLSGRLLTPSRRCTPLM